MSGEYDTDVLVVGSGPTGATCALALATYGVRVRVATKWNWLANGPRAHITNQRALEVLRDLGVEAEATSVATPWNLMGDTMFTTSLAGEEVARLRTWGTGENRIGDYLQGSPCPLLDIPQPYMEPVLIKNAAARGAEIMFSTEYLSHVQDDNGVTVHPARPPQRPRVHRPRPVPGRRRRRPVRDRRGTRPADRGCHGPGRHHLHAVQGRPDPVRGAPAEHPALDHDPRRRLRRDRHGHSSGPSGPGTSGSPAGDTTSAAGEPDLRPEAVLPRIREMIGDPDVEVEIENVTTW